MIIYDKPRIYENPFHFGIFHDKPWGRPIETSRGSTAEGPTSWRMASTWPFTPLAGKMTSTLPREHDRLDFLLVARVVQPS